MRTLHYLLKKGLPLFFINYASISYAEVIDEAEMVSVPAGEFMMGCDPDKDFFCAFTSSEQQHNIIVKAFKIDKYEVTFQRYQKCVSTGKCLPPATGGALNYGWEGVDKFPVNGVTWFQAKAFCEWEGKRLPTEAEWEKAARGTDGRLYPWGNEAPSCDYTVMNQKVEGNTIGPGCGAGTTQVVGSKPKGASPYGVMDMSGNLFEWTADWYDEKYYQYSPKNNPKGAQSGEHKTVRGSSWLMRTGSGLVATVRSGYSPLGQGYVVGFRCAHSEGSSVSKPVDNTLPPAIELNSDGFLSSLQTSPHIIKDSGNEVLVQDKDSHLLDLYLPQKRLHVRPIRTSTNTAQHKLGMHEDNSGILHMVAKADQAVTVLAALQQYTSFNDTLKKINLKSQQHALGVLRVSQITKKTYLNWSDTTLWMAARAAYESHLVADDSSLGLYAEKSANNPNQTLYTWYFKDELGTYKQLLYPTPAYWEELKTLLSASGQPSLDSQGRITHVIGDKTYHAVMDYRVESSGVTDGKAKLNPINDVNNDTTSDFEVIYANGEKQVLYILPAAS